MQLTAFLHAEIERKKNPCQKGSDRGNRDHPDNPEISINCYFIALFQFSLSASVSL